MESYKSSTSTANLRAIVSETIGIFIEIKSAYQHQIENGHIIKSKVKIANAYSENHEVYRLKRGKNLYKGHVEASIY